MDQALPDLRGFTIAFDLDGTLVDTAPDLIGALNAVLAEQVLAPVPLAAARHLVGRGARKLIERGFADAGALLDEVDVPPLVTRFLAVYRSRIVQDSKVFPGVAEALDALALAGARLCVCTNKPTDLALLVLDALGLTRRFSAVVGPGDAPAAKPDPRHYLATIEAAGGVPERSLMVGDSAADVDAAHAAGAPVVVVGFGYTETPAADLGGDALIEHYAELPAAVAMLLGPARLRAVRPSAIGGRS